MLSSENVEKLWICDKGERSKAQAKLGISLLILMRCISIDLLLRIFKLIEGKIEKKEIRPTLAEIFKNIKEDKLVDFIQGERIGKWNYLIHIDFEVILSFIGALKGDIYDFGSVWDFLFYDNQAWIWSLITSMAWNKSVFWYKEDHEWTLRGRKIRLSSQNINELLKAHIAALFKPWMNLEVWEAENNTHFNTLFNILGSTLNERNETFQGFFKIDDELIKEQIVDPEMLSFVQDLETGTANVKNISQLVNNYEIKYANNSSDNHFGLIKRLMWIDKFKKKEVSFSNLDQKNEYESLREWIQRHEHDSNKRKNKAEYKEEDEWILVSFPEVLEIILKVSMGDKESYNDLIVMLNPLFREFPGVMDIGMIVKDMINDKKDEILKHLPNLFNILLLSSLHHKLRNNSKDESSIKEERKENRIDFKFDRFAINESVCEVISNLTKLWAFILSNEIMNKTPGKCISHVDKIVDSFKTKLEEDGETRRSVKSQKLMFQFIIGIWKEDYLLMSDVGNALGVFNENTVMKLMGIMKKFKSTMFNNEAYGLPEASKEMQDSHFSFKNIINSPNNQAKRTARKEGEGLDVNKEVREKFAEAPDAMSVPASDLNKTIDCKELFDVFDQDGSGQLSYGEFKDICKYLGLIMDQEKSLKMFSLVDTDKNNYIDYDEFSKAIILIKFEIAKDMLRKLELSNRDLIRFWIGILFCLTAALFFVIFGTFAYSSADGFSAVLSSIPSIGAGILAIFRILSKGDKVKSMKKYIDEFIDKNQKEEK